LIEIVVKVHIGRTQVSSQKSGMSGEHGGNVKVTGATQNEANAGQPFMELCDKQWLALLILFQALVDFFKEPGHAVAKDKRIVGLSVVMWDANVGHVPKVVLPLVQLI